MHHMILAATAAVCVACFTGAGNETAMPDSAPAMDPGTPGGGRADDQAGGTKSEEKRPPTRKERLRQIVKDQNRDWQQRSEALNAMKPGAERDQAAAALQTAGIPFARQALDLAREDENDEIAFTAAFYAFTGGGGTKTTSDAADFIANRLADDGKVVPSMTQMARSRDGLDLLARLAKNTKSKEIRGAALFAILDCEVDAVDRPPPGKALSADETAARFAAATDKLKKLATEYAGVNASTRFGDSVSEAARKKLFFIDRLTVGKKAPDLECALLDGRKARLSDFRGNVVVLDFWTTWCTPCRAMIPHERALVERLKGKPFRLLSISADDEKETLVQFLEKEKMPWLHAWSGAAGGIADEYQVDSYPTIFVLDAQGVIRFKHVRNEAMDHAVETLLQEMSGGK
jgi:thiol-disulfide isomerase/thioredoxin